MSGCTALFARSCYQQLLLCLFVTTTDLTFHTTFWLPYTITPASRGTQLANFNAFVEQEWRENDILWGRLDAPEPLISSLVPWREHQRLGDQFVGDPQRAITEDFDVSRRLKERLRARIMADRADRHGSSARWSARFQAQLDPIVRHVQSTVNTQTFPEIAKTCWQTAKPTMEPEQLLKATSRATEIVGRLPGPHVERAERQRPGRRTG